MAYDCGTSQILKSVPPLPNTPPSCKEVLMSSPHLFWFLNNMETEECVNTVESRLFNITGTKGWSDNQKFWIIWKTNERNEGRQLNL